MLEQLVVGEPPDLVRGNQPADQVVRRRGGAVPAQFLDVLAQVVEQGGELGAGPRRRPRRERGPDQHGRPLADPVPVACGNAHHGARQRDRQRPGEIGDDVKPTRAHVRRQQLIDRGDDGRPQLLRRPGAEGRRDDLPQPGVVGSRPRRQQPPQRRGDRRPGELKAGRLRIGRHRRMHRGGDNLVVARNHPDPFETEHRRPRYQAVEQRVRFAPCGRVGKVPFEILAQVVQHAGAPSVGGPRRRRVAAPTRQSRDAGLLRLVARRRCRSGTRRRRSCCRRPRRSGRAPRS